MTQGEDAPWEIPLAKGWSSTVIERSSVRKSCAGSSPTLLAVGGIMIFSLFALHVVPACETPAASARPASVPRRGAGGWTRPNTKIAKGYDCAG
jgi:hypothetical protein